MSGSGAPTIEVTRMEGARVAIVAAQWHPKVTDGLLAGALRALEDSGVADHTVIRVPGSFELPVATLHAAKGCWSPASCTTRCSVRSSPALNLSFSLTIWPTAI